MAMPPSLTREKALAVYHDPAKTHTEAARNHGVSRAIAAKIRRGIYYRHIHEPEKPTLRFAKRDKYEITRLHEQGWSMMQIARATGYKRGGVQSAIRRVREERLQPEPAKPQALSQPTPAPVDPQIHPSEACTACRQDYARKGEDLCNGCASKVQRVDGYGDGPLPHYEGKAKKAASQMGRKAAQTRWLQANSNAIRKRTKAA
jgi:transposase-like protein